MRHPILGTLLALAVAGPVLPDSAPRLRSPRLSLRATPRFALSAPVHVLATAELVGGDEVEEYYCPALDWEWGDGSRSVHQPDCAPFESGGSLERRFTAAHVFRGPGAYTVRLTLRRMNRSVAAANATVTVH